MQAGSSRFRGAVGFIFLLQTEMLTNAGRGAGVLDGFIGSFLIASVLPITDAVLRFVSRLLLGGSDCSCGKQQYY
jgi:hypothetical protein